MHARTTTLQVSPDRIDDAIRELESEQLPRFREQDGYKGFTVLADRASGKVLGISYWEGEAELQASESLGDESRRRAAATGGATGEPTVERFEVLLDDMV